MALISATNLTNSYDNVDRTSYTTASVTLTAGKLHLMGVGIRIAASVLSPTVSGTGTWIEIESQTNSLQVFKCCLFACVPGSDETGAITLDFSGVTQTGVCWTVDQFTGAAVGGSSASSIVQTADNLTISSTTSVSATLGAFSHIQNATYGFGAVQLNEALTVGDGFSQLSQGSGATPPLSYMSEFRNGNDTTVDFSWTTANINGIIIAAEIAHSPYPKIITL